ncbi:MAG TPA: 50S ribosomal protein L32 [bacterium]|jgi:large subunit ribosomal protein L32|nr:50S ribosomal protein L32 [bacterium]
MVQMKKRTKSATNNRRSHHALKPKTLNKCSKCSQPVMPHRACANCGTYRSTEAVKVKAPKAKK